MIDHSLLLCGLFLGFHLESYVTIGLDKKNNACVWVTTIEGGKVCFWDTIKGISFPQSSPNIPFRTVGCCFNSTHLYANVQLVDGASECNFDFKNEKLWKGMSTDALASCKRAKLPFPFRNLTSELPDDKILERALLQRVKAYRQDHGIQRK